MNLLRSFKIIVCVVLVAVTLCGCMNSVNLKDIKDIVVVEGMGIDAVDDELELTLQTLNISSNSGGERSVSSGVLPTNRRRRDPPIPRATCG